MCTNEREHPCPANPETRVGQARVILGYLLKKDPDGETDAYELYDRYLNEVFRRFVVSLPITRGSILWPLDPLSFLQLLSQCDDFELACETGLPKYRLLTPIYYEQLKRETAWVPHGRLLIFGASYR